MMYQLAKLIREYFASLPGGNIPDWVKALNVQKERALVDMFREYAASLRGLTIVEQIERFRVACHRRGVDCPPEFPVLLQRF